MKGFSLIRAEWEGYIQNINALYSLTKTNNEMVSNVRDINSDIKTAEDNTKKAPKLQI